MKFAGVWSLLVTDNFSHVISGSRDKKVCMTEIRNPSNSVLVCEESASVLSLCYNIDQTGIWVSYTTVAARTNRISARTLHFAILRRFQNRYWSKKTNKNASFLFITILQMNRQQRGIRMLNVGNYRDTIDQVSVFYQILQRAKIKKLPVLKVI